MGMTTAITIPATSMTTEAAAPATQLGLMWLASPALPVGGFSYSEGLEAALEAGWISGEADTRDWLLDQLALGLARADLAVVAQALAAWQADDAARIAELNAWVGRTRESSELRLQTEQMGRSLLEWLRNGPARDRHPGRLAALANLRPAPTWHVAFALAATEIDAAPQQTLLSFAFGWAENMVQAAIKAVPLGQSAGQRILQALVAAVPQAVGSALSLAEDDRQAFTPMLAVLSARHESQYSRLFRS